MSRGRIAYGSRVLRFAAGVLRARLRGSPASSRDPVPANTLFSQDRVRDLQPERRTLEQHDLYLYEVMNSERLKGQIVFEYGTLLRMVDSWAGRRVLDVGTGRSTFPSWMSAKGADVITFDLAAPAELGSGGFQSRVNALVSHASRPTTGVAGSMRQLPFADGSFDIVTCFSVLEHLDTDLPRRDFVPYPEQCRRLHEVLDEMVRVTRPGGAIYITSECCDFDRATVDHWRSAYYYDNGPALSAAWPVRDVAHLYYEHFAARNCSAIGGVQFDPRLIADPSHWTLRGPYFSGFSVWVRKA